MTENRLSRRELMEWINVVSFAVDDVKLFLDTLVVLSLIHISEPTRQEAISYAVFCLKKKMKEGRSVSKSREFGDNIQKCV